MTLKIILWLAVLCLDIIMIHLMKKQDPESYKTYRIYIICVAVMYTAVLFVL